MADKISLEYKTTVKELKQLNEEYRNEFQELIASYLDEVRYRTGSEELIGNTTGFINPYMARKKQPSTSGRMTSRTGKFKLMLQHRAKPYGSGFKGNLRRVKSTMALDLVVSRKGKDKLEQYSGTIRYNFKGHGRLTSTGSDKFRPKMMPKETRETLYMRFLKDKRSVKGDPPRPTISKKAQEVSLMTRRIAEIRLDKLATRYNSK